MNKIDTFNFISEDIRKRKYLLPSTVVKTEGTVIGEENLLKQKALQIALREFDVTVLENKSEKHASVLLDFGCEFHGGIRILTAKMAKPTRIRITFGESISEATSDIGYKYAGNDHSPRDFETTIPRLADIEFGQTGFRYVRIELLEDEARLNIKSIIGVFVYRDMQYVGSFNCSDPLLNKIYDTAAYTVHLNMQNMLWDGIKRDRLVWVGDTHPEYLAIRSLFDNCSIVFENLRFAREEAVLPGWMNGMPSYSFWWLIILRDVSFTSDDYSLVKESKTYIEGLLEQIFSKINSDGTHDFGRYFLDWQTKNKPEAVAGVHALMYMAIEAVGEMCSVIDNNELADKCKEYCRILKKQVPSAYNCSSANALLILADLGGDLDVIINNGEFDMSTLMSYYISSALSQNGYAQKAIDMIRSYYGGMLDMGATTFWEDFDMRWLENATRIDEFPTEGKLCVHADRGQHCYRGLRHSLCHGWSAGPVAFLAEYVLGIRFTAAGGKSATLAPMLCDLEYANGSYPTKYGRIIVEWRKEGDKTVLKKLIYPREINITLADGVVDESNSNDKAL